MLRILDFFIALFGLVFAFPFLIILFIIGLFDTGSPVFRQERVGRNQKPFILVKFRTMKVDTASVASHLASTASITPFGGFLRKTATAIQYFKNRQKKQHQQIIHSLNRLPFFEQLPETERQMLLQKFRIVEFMEDEIIYHHSDIQNTFYIILKGDVKLRDPKLFLKTFIELTTSDSFGRMAFFTSQANATLAQAKTNVTLWKIEREDFNDLLSKTYVLPKILIQFYEESIELIHYLKDRHQMQDEQISEHLQKIIASIKNQQKLPETPVPKDTFEQALARLKTTQRFELFSNCDKDIQPLIANKLQLRTLSAGQTLFSNRSNANRLYLLESGSVELLNPLQKKEEFEYLKPGDFFWW